MLDDRDQSDNEKHKQDKATDKHRDPGPFRGGKNGTPAGCCTSCLGLKISTRKHKQERGCDERRYDQREKKPPESKASSL